MKHIWNEYEIYNKQYITYLILKTLVKTIKGHKQNIVYG